MQRWLLAALLVLPFTAAVAGAQDTRVDKSRELAGIAEEQALLLRQLQRLKSTMEVLLQRTEAEGRTRTAELIREGLRLLDERSEEEGTPLTVEEQMLQVRGALDKGQLVQSLERQSRLVADLERLLEILLDRENLDALEERLAELRAQREELDRLTSAERDLQADTEALRERATSAEQKDLQQRLEALQTAQTETLRATEELGRSSGTLELEQLEQALEELLSDQRIDQAVLEGWRPEEREALAAPRASLQRALTETARRSRLQAAAEELEAAAGDVREAPSQNELEAVRQRLADAADRAERHARIANDPTVEQAAQALAEGRERAREAAAGEREPEAAAADLTALAEAMRAAARALEPAAETGRAEAREALKELAGEDTAGGRAAQESQELLEEATEAAERGDLEHAEERTEAAARSLERAERDLGFLGTALAGSQEEQAQTAARIERGLESLPQAESESTRAATEALQRAQAEMNAASQAAGSEKAQEAQARAAEATKALEEATRALAAARAEAASSQAAASQELVQAQAQAAAEAKSLAKAAQQGSMTPQSAQAAQEALQKAAKSMEQAGQELSEGRSASSASSQREALRELDKARQQAQEGVAPTTPEDRARAEELAREQARIREEILRLAKRMEDNPGGRDPEAMQRASEAAEQAEGELEEGDLSQAQRQEERVERELQNQREELTEEERQYQRLRQEEQLFRMIEELQGLHTAHLEQVVQVSEIHTEREPGERPSRAQRIRLRQVVREEQAVGARAGEIADEVEKENAPTYALFLREIQSDLDQIARALGDEGDYDTGERVQGQQRDVEEHLAWMIEALSQERSRREQEAQQESQSQDPSQKQDPDRPPPLVPPVAQLKLLRRMEVEVQDSVRQLLELYPELSAGGEVDEVVLEDVTRLAVRHERITDNFRQLRESAGIPAPEEVDQ